MRKLKLFFAAAALLFGVGAQAQKDVTSQYITNATLSDGTNGWTVSNFNAPQRGNNTVGYASEAYAGWGGLDKTSYSLTQNITLPAGHYTLVNYSFFRQGQDYNTNSTKSLAKLKAGSNEVALKTLGSITAGGYANSQAEGANAFDSKMYRNALDFTIDADNTTIEIGLVGTFDEARSWCIAGMFELIDNDQLATMDSPFDVTGYITNPGFEYRNMTGWTLAGEAVFGTQNNNQSFKVGGYYAEKWQASGALPAGSMSQTLTGLPAGLYRLTANLGGDGTYIDLNGKTVNWTADGNYTASYVLGDNENLVITAGKTAEGTANWIHFDNFKLLYCGNVMAALSGSLAKKTSYNGVIPTAAYNKLLEDVASYDKSYSDVDELLAAVDAVEALYTAANELKAPYAAWLAAKAVADGYNVEGINSVVTAQNVEEATTAASITTATTAVTALTDSYAAFLSIKAYADEFVVISNDNATATSTLSEAISTQASAAASATTVEAINSAKTALEDAIVTFVSEANPVGDGNKFDLTFMLTNPDVTSFWTGAWGVAPAGWFTDQEGGNFQVMNNGSVNAVDGIHDIFMEYYYLSNNATWGNGKFNIYTQATLPAGTYTMNCYAFAKEENYSSGNPNPQVYFYANDTQGSLVSSNKLTEQSISFVNDSKQIVKIGLKPLSGNTYNWMGIGYVKLYKVPEKTFIVDETVAWDNTQSGAGDVTLNRTIKVGVNTVAFPFSMTQAEVEDKFGAGSKVYVVDAYDASAANISFSVYDGISANKPCLLQATQGGESYSLENRTIVAGTPDATGTNVTMTGTYAASMDVPTDSYIISGDKIYQVNSTVTLKNTRAYITVTDPAPARVLTMSFGGEVTGIATIENGQFNIETGVIYDLSGRKVTAPAKGIYVINGKKIVK